jgi:hypothetical protein
MKPIVIAIVVAMMMLYTWGVFLIGHSQGLIDGAKQCPEESQRMLLHSTSEYKDGIVCRYALPKRRRA